MSLYKGLYQHTSSLSQTNLPSYLQQIQTMTVPIPNGELVIDSRTGNTISTIRDNITGGRTVYDNSGNVQANIKDNIIGHTSITDAGGNSIGSVRENLDGSHTFMDKNFETIGSARPNVFEGHDFYSNHGELIGSSRPNIFGGNNYEFKAPIDHDVHNLGLGSSPHLTSDIGDGVDQVFSSPLFESALHSSEPAISAASIGFGVSQFESGGFDYASSYGSDMYAMGGYDFVSYSADISTFTDFSGDYGFWDSIFDQDL